MVLTEVQLDIIEYLSSREAPPTPSELFNDLPFYPLTILYSLTILIKKGVVEYRRWINQGRYLNRIVLV